MNARACIGVYRLPRALYLTYLAIVGLTFAICLAITTRTLQRSLKIHEATQSVARRNAISIKFRSFVILSRLVSGAFLIAATYQVIYHYIASLSWHVL